MTGPNGLDVLARMLPSLAVIVGALLLLRRFAQRGRGSNDAGVRVLTRAGVTRGAVVAVVEVGARRFLVGAGDHGVSLLSELEPDTEISLPPAMAVAAAPAGMDLALARPALHDRPGMGPIHRLRSMTVRTQPRRPIDALRRP